MSRVRSVAVAATSALVALAASGCGASAPTVSPPSLATTQSVPASTGATAAPTVAPAPATVAPGGAPVRGSADPNRCHSAMLALSLGSGEGAAGTIYQSLRFTNISGRTCTLQGFPGVSYVAGNSGVQIGPAAERDGVKGPSVSLAPGAVASAELGMTQVLNFDASACRPTPTRGLRVYPPNETASLFVPVTGTGCAGTPPGPQLRVTTIKAGPGDN